MRNNQIGYLFDRLFETKHGDKTTGAWEPQKNPQGTPKELPRNPQGTPKEPPRNPQETPKKLPRNLQGTPKNPKDSQTFKSSIASTETDFNAS